MIIRGGFNNITNKLVVYPDELKKNIDGTIYDETINDAVEIAKALKKDKRLKKDEIYILGHSFGGYAMPRIAEGSDEAAGFIIMAGPARGHHELIPEQVEYLLSFDGEIDETEQVQMDSINKDLEKLENLESYDSFEVILGMYKAYLQDLISYDPIETASTISKPVLVLQGERDYQVTKVDYKQWNDHYGEKNNWSFKLYPKLNHLMMLGEVKPSNKEYGQVNSVDLQVITDIATWIKDLKSK
jgi:alpha-beta hydrolase superfamily lysophospholipase